MTRIPMVDGDDGSDQLHGVFDQLLSTRGRVPSMYRILGHRPPILAAHRAYFHAALDTGLLERSFKEKIAFRVAALCGSAYSQASHRRYAIQHGVAEEELDAIEASDFRALNLRERLAFRFAEEAITELSGPSPETFAAASHEFSPAELVELSALIGLMQLASTLGAIFRLEPDGRQ